MSVFQELFKSPKDTDVTREDQIVLVTLCGRRIGRTRDGRREYVVYDGKVYIKGQAGGCVDYFEFCRALRTYDQQPIPPAGIVMDFMPDDSFHLGWPKAQGEIRGASPGGLPSEPMQGAGPNVQAAGRVLRTPKSMPSGESADGGMVPAPFELVNDEGGHGGPHFGLYTATHAAAGLLLGGSSKCIHIVPRDHRVLDARNAVRRVFKQDGVALYQDHPSHIAQPVAELVG